MGYSVYHSIVVVSWDDKMLAQAHELASSVGASVSPIVPGVINGVASFLVATDGSKEGWPASATGDAQRTTIKDFLRSKAHSDGSNSLKWFEVSHPEDELAPRIIDHQTRRGSK